jgi:hypothetical protein
VRGEVVHGKGVRYKVDDDLPHGSESRGGGEVPPLNPLSTRLRIR